MPRLALAFLAGIVIVETRAALENIERLMLALLAVSMLLFVPRARWLALLALGVLWATWRAELRLEQRLDPALEGRDLVIAGEIVSIPEPGTRRVQFDFAPGAQPGLVLPGLIRLSWYDAPRVPRAAERWQLQVRLRTVRAFANEGGFDYEGQLFRESIGATGYVRASRANRLLGAAGWTRPVLRLRATIARRMSEVLGHSSATGVLTGLAVGATLGITTEQWRVFSATGTTHLIAISGLHVTMLAAVAMWIARILWRVRRRPPRTACIDAANLSGAAVATVYALLAGFSVPTQRTLVMLIVALGAIYLRRAQPASHALALALFLVLLIDPHAALTPGFWLSFVAVAAIFLTLSAQRTQGRIQEFLRTQAAVTLALAPATLVLFGSLSLIAPLANLFAIPLFSAVLVPLTLAGVALLGVVPLLGEWILELAARIFELSWPALEFAARQPAALIHVPSPAPWHAVALGLAALIALLPFPARLRVIGIAIALPLATSSAGGPSHGEIDVDVLDVGQGLAVVLRTQNHVLVYDTGPAFRSGRSAGDLAVVPFLRANRVRRVDLLVLSHADSDHAGGALALLASIPASSVRFSGAAAVFTAPAAPCRRGEAWDWDGVRFEFLHPADGEHWGTNDGSCVLRVATRRHSLLIAGDIERAAERHLVALERLPPTSVVIVPHHGSRSSSTPELTHALGATYALVSAGTANRWGFPDPAVVRRWCDSGAAVINTADWGGVRLRLSASETVPVPSSHRLKQRRYWHSVSARAGQSLCAACGVVPVALWYHPAPSLSARSARGMWEIIQAGGPFMWPIILCSIGAAAITLERLWTLQWKRVLPAELTDQVWKWVQHKQVNPKLITALEQNSPLGKVLAVGLANRHRPREIMIERLQDTGRHVVHELERFLNTLGTIASISPLLGLLGTVTGIINAFSAISTGGMGDPRVLSAGISEALLATAAGLCVAIPSLFAYRFLRGKVDRIVIQMEKEAMKLVEAIEAGEGQAAA